MSTRELAETVFSKLSAMRARDNRLDRGDIRGISEIAGWVQAPKALVREALLDLHDEGRVERLDFSNGVYWRGLPQHDQHVKAREYERWINGDVSFR